MIYKFYTDKAEEFVCEVKVQNASVKNAIVRLIIETNDVNVIFVGKVDGNKCIIPVKKLNGILNENTTGNAKLELILEDTYFNPWNSECKIERFSKVEINEVKNTVVSRPAVSVAVESQNKTLILEEKTAASNAIKQLNYIFERLGINIKKNKKDAIQILHEFFKENVEYKNFKRSILREFITKNVAP